MPILWLGPPEKTPVTWAIKNRPTRDDWIAALGLVLLFVVLLFGC